MKNLTQLLFTLFCLCLPAMLQAQDKDDSKYLAGAVPEVDGKVVFTKEFSIASPACLRMKSTNVCSAGWMPV